MAASKAPLKQFEKSIVSLEKLVQNLEKGDLGLEESLRQFEKGIALTRACQSALTEAEQKVSLLIESHGQLEEVPFDDISEDSEE